MPRVERSTRGTSFYRGGNCTAMGAESVEPRESVPASGRARVADHSHYADGSSTTPDAIVVTGEDDEARDDAAEGDMPEAPAV